MKTTLDIDDELLDRVRCHATNTGQSLSDVIEDGLRRVLSSDPRSPESREYRLPDLSRGDPSADDPLAEYSWKELSEMIYDSEPWSRSTSTGRAPES